VSDDDVVVNPTFGYLLQAEFGFRLPAGVRGKAEFSVLIDLDMTSDKVKFVHFGTHLSVLL
jgi:hypothetical protein